MDNKKKIVCVSCLGTRKDKAKDDSHARWSKWRPNVALFQRDDLLIDRLELFYDDGFLSLAEEVKRDIAQVSPQTHVNLVAMNWKDPWDFSEVYTKFHDWAKDYTFHPDEEEYWVHMTTGTHVAQICLFLMVEARTIPGKLLQSSPPKTRFAQMSAEDIGHYELIDLDLARYDVIAQRLEDAREDAVRYLKSNIATRNPAFNQLITEIEQVAMRSSAPILLSGATGVGKSMLAKRIYELKKVRHLVSGRLLDVNCATLKGDSASSALFGHKKGSFTGAIEAREGYLRAAHQGVLFLDEIGELGLDEQAMLLKAIEEKRFYPVGSDQAVESDFQLIAGTNRDLRVDVKEGRFRADLYARINLWHFALPALVQRREDIEPNIEHQLALVSQELGRVVRFNKEALAMYLKFAHSTEALWSGNFRDLSSSITRLATLAPQGRIQEELVAAEIQKLKWFWSDSGEKELQDIRSSVAIDWDALDFFEQLQLEAVIRECRCYHSMAEAGRALFNRSREQKARSNDSDRLRKYLQKYGLKWGDI